MNLFANIPMPEPSTIKHLLLVLFVIVTLGVKLADIVEARKR